MVEAERVARLRSRARVAAEGRSAMQSIFGRRMADFERRVAEMGRNPPAGPAESPLSVLARERDAADALTAYLANHAGVPRRFLDVDLDRLPADLPDGYRRTAKRLATLHRRPVTMVLSGPVGLGKTALACGLCRYVKARGRSCRYRTAYGLVRAIADAPFSDKGKLRAAFAAVDLLVVDELGDPHSHQPGGVAELIEVIDTRYAAERATLLLTNLDADGLWEMYGQKVQRRVAESGGFHAASWPRIKPVVDSRKAGSAHA